MALFLRECCANFVSNEYQIYTMGPSQQMPDETTVETPDSVVLSEIDARGVATVTLNRPQVFNSYNPALLTGLTQTLTMLEADERVRVVLLRGADLRLRLRGRARR